MTSSHRPGSRRRDTKETSAIPSKEPVNRDPNFIYSRPRVTTDEQIEAARQRYFLRKAAGIVPVTVDSDTE
ncbi:unnamed protein product [Echinostoma caproni]|uniref:SUZ domain-containing protein n=1 Tax=Echinostoma caproni TaxID=27848 RepID=A0A183B202_9TREM|nr:unnamed protein product [Echinostoma caproni]